MLRSCNIRPFPGCMWTSAAAAVVAVRVLRISDNGFRMGHRTVHSGGRGGGVVSPAPLFLIFLLLTILAYSNIATYTGVQAGFGSGSFGFFFFGFGVFSWKFQLHCRRWVIPWISSRSRLGPGIGVFVLLLMFVLLFFFKAYPSTKAKFHGKTETKGEEEVRIRAESKLALSSIR